MDFAKFMKVDYYFANSCHFLGPWGKREYKPFYMPVFSQKESFKKISSSYVYDKETNTKIRLKSATMDRLNYVYEKADGSSMFGQFEGPYLPAIPILLLR